MPTPLHLPFASPSWPPFRPKHTEEAPFGCPSWTLALRSWSAEAGFGGGIPDLEESARSSPPRAARSPLVHRSVPVLAASPHPLPVLARGACAEPLPEFWEVVVVEDGGLWVPVPALEVPRGRVSQAAVPCTHRSAGAQRRCHLPQSYGQRDGPAGGERHPQVGSCTSAGAEPPGCEGVIAGVPGKEERENRRLAWGLQHVKGPFAGRREGPTCVLWQLTPILLDRFVLCSGFSGPQSCS